VTAPRIGSRPDTGTLPVWNTVVPAVALIRADSAETAVTMLRWALRQCGFEVYEDPDGEYGTGAFESEPAEPSPLPAPRTQAFLTGREYYQEQETG
jgi:hypothetical protein